VTRVLNFTNLSGEQHAEIEHELSRHQNLDDVMKWALAHPPGVFRPTVVADVIVQDEFTHDVVIPWRDGLFLVYDTT
jgi:hypothetical protein